MNDLLTTIREALHGQIDRNRRLAGEFTGTMSQHYVEQGAKCRAALDHLDSLPDDAVLVWLVRRDWAVAADKIDAWEYRAWGDGGGDWEDPSDRLQRIAADIRRQTGEG